MLFSCWHPVPPKDYEEISFYIGFGALHFDRFRTRENLKGVGRAIELMCDTTAKSFEENIKFQEFLKAIPKIGLDEVAKVGIMFKGYNLVDTRQRTDKGRVWQKQVGNYFVYSYLSNGEKLKCLTKINNYYNLGLKIEAK